MSHYRYMKTNHNTENQFNKDKASYVYHYFTKMRVTYTGPTAPELGIKYLLLCVMPFYSVLEDNPRINLTKTKLVMYTIILQKWE